MGRSSGFLFRFPSSFRQAAGGLAVLAALVLAGCAVAPIVYKAPPTLVTVVTDPEKTKSVLEKIQSSDPQYTIQALLSSKGDGTEVRLSVYASHTVHKVVRGFQEPSPHKRLYPDCNRWFNLTRNFDPACGGGPYIGTANLIFADGMVFGALFDLVQAGRYPFTWTKAVEPDKDATKVVMDQLRSATGTQGTTRIPFEAPLVISTRSPDENASRP